MKKILLAIIIVNTCLSYFYSKTNKIVTQDEISAETYASALVPTLEPLSTSIPVTSKYSAYEGLWVYDLAPLDEDTSVPYYGLYIDSVSDNDIEFSLTCIARNLGQREASFSQSGKIVDGKVNFSYEDGWSNQGNGELEFISNSQIKLTLKSTYFKPGARWSVGDFEDVLHRPN